MSGVKYKESPDYSYFLDKNHFVYDVQEDESELRIYVKSRPHICKCPACGTESNRLHATYERRLQDIPVRGKRTYLYVNVYKYECVKETCKCKVFMEELSFAGTSQVRTDALNAMVLWFGEFLGNRDASRLLSQLGIKASPDTVRRLRQKKDEGKDSRFMAGISRQSGQDWGKVLREREDIRLGSGERAGTSISAAVQILPDNKKLVARMKLQGSLPEDIRSAAKK
ncbi:MAG: transposase family protein [Clostridiales bacterium]|nr:transposase family protein [Clostridiales bacterium]